MLQPTFEPSEFVQSLARDFADQQAVERWRGPREQGGTRTGPVLTSDELRKLAIIRLDLANVGVVVALATSIVAYVETHTEAMLSIQSLRAFMPRLSQATLAAAATLGDAAMEQDFLPLWQSFDARLTLARDMSLDLCESAKGASAGCFGSASATADAWTRACRALIEVHQWIAARAPLAGTDSRAADERQTLDLLRAAMNGGTPCIDRDGKVSVPGWAERRSSPRWPTDHAAVLEADGDRHLGRVVDASASGACIVTGASFPKGAPLMVRVADAVGLAGRVRWAAAGRIGIAFEHPMPAGHPLWRSRPASLATTLRPVPDLPCPCGDE